MFHRRTSVLLAIIALVSSLGLFGCSANPEPAQVAVSSAQENNGLGASSPSVISAEAGIVPYKNAYLSSKSSGRVLEVLVTEGQEVKAGQELLKLDARDQDLVVRRAESSLKSAQAQLDKARNGARPEEVAQAQAAWAIVEAGVAEAEKAVEISRANVTVAQARLGSAQASLARVKAGAMPQQLNEAAAIVASAQAAQKQAQAAYDRVQGDPNIGSLPQALQLEQATNELNRANAAYQNLLKGATPAEIRVAEAGVLEAEAGVVVAEAQTAQSEAHVQTVKNQQAEAQARLDLVKAGSRSEDIAIAEAAVSQSEIALSEARAALEDTVVKAPFDGVVGDVLVNEGELVVPQMQLVRIGDLTRLQAETKDLSEVDVNQIQIGQKATIRVDALGSQTFAGVVSRVAPVASDNRGDRVYKVTLDLDAGLADGLRWGMTAFVDVDVR